MKCSCDIKLLFSVGCKCGGFAAEQAARPPSLVSVVDQAKQQHQILVCGHFTGSLFWILDDEWQCGITETMKGIVDIGFGRYEGMRNHQVDICRSLLKPVGRGRVTSLEYQLIK